LKIEFPYKIILEEVYLKTRKNTFSWERIAVDLSLLELISNKLSTINSIDLNGLYCYCAKRYNR
jgi:hypothetical protein